MNQLIIKFMLTIKNIKLSDKHLLIVLVIFGFILRIWFLKDGLHFGYDQARDALVIAKIIETKKIILIGPTTGIQGVFLGPFYYYLLLPFYWLGKGNPLFPIVGLAVLNSLGIYLAYLLGKKMFNRQIGIFFGFLVSFSAIAIQFSRTMFNPNPLIFISMLMFYLSYLVHQGKTKFLPWVALLAGLSLQTELANAFFLLLALVLYLLPSVKKIGFKKIAFSAGIFLLTFMPQVLFDLRHESLLFTALKNNFINDQNKTSLSAVWQSRPLFLANWFIGTIFPQIKFQSSLLYLVILTFLFLVLIFPLILYKRHKHWRSSINLLLLWLFVPVVCYLFYTGNYGLFFDYYLISLFIPFYLLLSLSLSQLLSSKFKIIFLSFFLVINLYYSGVFIPTDKFGYSIGRLKQAVSYILSKADSTTTISARSPNGIPATYEYLFYLLAKNTSNEDIFYRQGNQDVFVIYEPDETVNNLGNLVPRDRFLKWYELAINEASLLESKTFGIVTVEHYQR